MLLYRVKSSKVTIKSVQVLLLVFFTATLAMADVQKDPIQLLIDFTATGQFANYNAATGETTYSIVAEGLAPEVKENGQIKARGKSEKNNVFITSAQITFDPFDPLNPPPIINFRCENCNLSFSDGTTLISDRYVPLIGRALFLYGLVAPDPAVPISTIRMIGCAGLRETSGQGPYANKVGSICFNGVFNFDVSDPTTIPPTLSGSSNCTIILHSPIVSLPSP